jgi:hypothetical protein
MRRSCLLLLNLAILPLLAGCGGGSTNTTSSPTSIFVNVSPGAVTVNIFGTPQQFTANVSGTANTAVNWQVNGIVGGSQASGYISSTGLYVAPGGVPTKSDGKGGSVSTTVTVTAVSQANPAASGSATVTIFPTNENAQSGAIMLGTSGGNANDSSTSGNKITCCGGTLGALVTRADTQYILSNNHVLARSDIATVGDPIIQPGLIDTGTCTSTGAAAVANLSQFFNLENGPTPKVDAALAQVVPNAVDVNGKILFLGATSTNGVPDPGAPHAGSGVSPTLNMAVAKSGRTTGLTCSTIISRSTVTSVEYQKGCGTSPPLQKFTVQYANQVDIAGGYFSAGGDSGSLIVTQDTADPVALLFAGSDTDTVANPISDVLDAMKDANNNVPTFVGGSVHPVIGCTLPTKPLSASQTVSAAALATEVIQKATAARDAHVPELMGHPEVQAVGVGASYDNPGEPAILFFVTKGQPRTGIPAHVDGVRTRIIEGELFARRGALSAAESDLLEQSAAPPQLVYSIPEAEVARAKIVHTAHVDELMKQAGVQGVGITSSVDSPGEAALMIYVIRGVAHDPIPPVIDGLRTRVRESSRFRAGFGDAEPHRACSLPVAKTAKRKTIARPQSKH